MGCELSSLCEQPTEYDEAPSKKGGVEVTRLGTRSVKALRSDQQEGPGRGRAAAPAACLPPLPPPSVKGGGNKGADGSGRRSRLGAGNAPRAPLDSLVERIPASPTSTPSEESFEDSVRSVSSRLPPSSQLWAMIHGNEVDAAAPASCKQLPRAFQRSPLGVPEAKQVRAPGDARAPHGGGMDSEAVGKAYPTEESPPPATAVAAAAYPTEESPPPATAVAEPAYPTEESPTRLTGTAIARPNVMPDHESGGSGGTGKGRRRGVTGSDTYADTGEHSPHVYEEDSDSDVEEDARRTDISMSELTAGGSKPLRKLGQGAFCNAFACTFEGRLAVVKIIREDVMDVRAALSDLEKEVYTLERLEHRNVIKLIGTGNDSVRGRFAVLEPLQCTISDRFSLGVEDSPPLKKMLRKKKLRKRHSFKERLRFAYELAGALVYLHEHAGKAKGAVAETAASRPTAARRGGKAELARGLAQEETCMAAVRQSHLSSGLAVTAPPVLPPRLSRSLEKKRFSLCSTATSSNRSCDLDEEEAAREEERWENRDLVVLHRDIKPKNVGLRADNSVVLFDFGLVKVCPRDIRQGESFEMTGEVGSLRYMAPEVAMCMPYNETSDVYSMALVVWEMLTSNRPFLGMGEQRFIAEVCEKGVRPPLDSRWPPLLRSTLQGCWRSDPTKRFSARAAARRFKECMDAC